MVSSEIANASFRDYLPDITSQRFSTARKQSPYEYVDAFEVQKHPKPLYDLAETWKSLLKEPFTGITTTGEVATGLFDVQNTDINISKICNSAKLVIERANEKQKRKLRYPLSAREWRCWSNPEFLLRPLGLRLEEVSDELALLILNVLETTLSPEGYQKAMAAMHTNHFLGELVDLPNIMNKYSYNFLLFGEPSTTEAWGWSLYGHHLCLSVFLKGGHISITPTFTGAEPNMIDEGEYAGTELLRQEGVLGLELMQSLPVSIQEQAQMYEQLYDPKLQKTGDLRLDCWNHDDQRHLCGAFRDNRVVPYEGVRVSRFTPHQKKLVLRIVEQFVLYLPSEPRRLRLEEVERHFESTYFSWIGRFGTHDAFYFRMQSPVIICEFDHHSGVFLTNKEPAKFHIHTIVRTPNSGDYGNVLREIDERVP